MQRECYLFTLQGINFCFAPGGRRKVTDGKRVRPGGLSHRSQEGLKPPHAVLTQEQDSTPGPTDLRARCLWEQNMQGLGENQDSLRVGILGNSYSVTTAPGQLQWQLQTPPKRGHGNMIKLNSLARQVTEQDAQLRW